MRPMKAAHKTTHHSPQDDLRHTATPPRRQLDRDRTMWLSILKLRDPSNAVTMTTR